MRERNKVLGLAGLAARAGKISSGAFSVEKAVKSGKAYLVVVAEDASANTRKQFQNMCEYYQVPVLVMADKERLGHSIGKELRVCMAVLDSNLAQAMIKEFDRERG